MPSLTDEKQPTLLNTKRILIKFDRITAWSLVGLMVLLFISGFGETKGIIPPAFAKFLHETLLPIPAIIAFAFHSAYGMHVAFKRWKIWNRTWSVIMVIYVISLVAGIVFFQFAVKTTTAVTVPTSIDL